MNSANLVSRYRRWHNRHADIAILPWLFIAVAALMTAATGGRFLRPGNLVNLAVQVPELGLLSLAMMIAMITSGINLSIISTANFSAVIMAIILTRIVPDGTAAAYMSAAVLLTILAGLAISAFLGFINGWLIGYIGVPAVLTTLGTMILYEGVTLAITRGFVISGLPEEFLFIGNGKLLGLPVPLLILVAVAAVLVLVLRHRPFGQYLYSIGSNIVATEFSGVNVRRTLVKAYVLSSVLAGIAAIVMLARFNSANARQGSSLLLQTVLICMLGGVDPNGGFGKVGGLLMALVILQIVTSGLNLLGVRSFATVAIWGTLLIGAIAYRTWYGKMQLEADKKRLRSNAAR